MSSYRGAERRYENCATAIQLPESYILEAQSKRLNIGFQIVIRRPASRCRVRVWNTNERSSVQGGNVFFKLAQEIPVVRMYRSRIWISWEYKIVHRVQC